MDTVVFRNIVTVGLRLGEMAWTEAFIHEYQRFLPEAQRENIVSFNLSQVYFYKRDYDKVIETLRHVEYEDVITNLNAKTLLLTTSDERDQSHFTPSWKVSGPISTATRTSRHGGGKVPSVHPFSQETGKDHAR